MTSSEPGPRPSPGWFEDTGGSGVMRWWDGFQWTHHTTVPAGGEPAASASAERRRAALSHLGVPLCSVFIPLLIWSSSTPGSLARTHARQAFSFQVVFLAVWVVLVGLQVAGTLSPFVLLAALGGAILIEVPNVITALAGRPPVRLIPFEPLSE